MTLTEYLAQQDLDAGRFAEKIGVSGEAVRRYALGRRTPRPAIMRRIVEATGGAVQPNDFLLDQEAESEAA